MQATVPKRNRRVMGNKWENDRVACEGAASKMSATWKGIFSAKGLKKEDRYKMFIDMQREKMKFDQERLILEKNKVELKRQEKVAKWEFEQTVTMHGLELEKEKLPLVREAADSRIVLQDINLLDDEGKKWLLRKKKRINDRDN